jgi:hypothetical protein
MPRISKEKLKFAKGGEQKQTTEIFRIHKAVAKFRDLCMNSRICFVNILQVSFMQNSVL